MLEPAVYYSGALIGNALLALIQNTPKLASPDFSGELSLITHGQFPNFQNPFQGAEFLLFRQAGSICRYAELPSLLEKLALSVSAPRLEYWRKGRNAPPRKQKHERTT
jgi:hypothetical protein